LIVCTHEIDAGPIATSLSMSPRAAFY